MPDWLKDSWVGLTGWLAFMAVLAKAIQSVYAAERDRTALAAVTAEREKLALDTEQLRASLATVDLQREKLTLEVGLLRNSSEVVADRRAVYDRLRALLSAVLETASPTLEQVRQMYQIQHDSEFAFPRDIAIRLDALNKSVFELHWSNRMLREPPIGMSEGQRQAIVTDNHGALNEIVAFQRDMVDLFRSHLNRSGE